MKKPTGPKRLRNRAHSFNLSKVQDGEHRLDSIPKDKAPVKKRLYVRKERIREVRERSRRGYYSHPEVSSKIAQRLIDLLGG